MQSISSLISTKSRPNEINLIEDLSDQMEGLLLNENCADVVFIIDKERLPAHRIILAARSEYFRALLFGGLSESNQREVHLTAPLKSFKLLLKYLYTGRLTSLYTGNGAVLGVLGLAHEYQLIKLQTVIEKNLYRYLNLNNVCAMLDTASLYNLEGLKDACLTLTDRYAMDFLKHKSFTKTSLESLIQILRRNTFAAPELEIFIAISEWYKHNPNSDIKSVVSLVRLTLISAKDLHEVVRPSGIVDECIILDALHCQFATTILPHRVSVVPKENVAPIRAGVMQISNGSSIRYSWHVNRDSIDDYIIIDFGSTYLINCIILKFINLTMKCFVEVAAKKKEWMCVSETTIINYPHVINFTKCPVRYIKVHGNDYVIHTFDVACLEALYDSKLVLK